MYTQEHGSTIGVVTTNIRARGRVVLHLSGDERQAGLNARPKLVAYGRGDELVLFVAGREGGALFLTVEVGQADGPGAGRIAPRLGQTTGRVVPKSAIYGMLDG